MAKHYSTREIQEMVLNPDVTKQDMAYMIFDFRDQNWLLAPILKNKTRIVSTLFAMLGVGAVGGHGLPELWNLVAPIKEKVIIVNTQDDQVINHNER